MYTKVVSVASTGAATQDITFTPNSGDPSWTPKIAIFNWSRSNTSQSAFAEHVSTGFGFTNGTASRCVAIASEDNQARGDSARIQRNDALLCALNPSGTIETVDAIATFNSWLTNGIRINWTDAPAANFYINVTFMGGDDIQNVDVGTLATGTATGNISVTSLAYQPEFGLFISGMNATDNTATVNALMSIGAATSSSAQWNQSVLTQDNPVTMITRQYFSHSKTVLSISTAGAVDGYATFSSFNSNGFTLNVADAFPASHHIYYLVVKGGQWFVGNGTEPGSTGNQTVTTNKDTKGVMMFGLKTNTADAPQNGHMSFIGSSDSAKNCAYIIYEDTNGVADSVIASILATTAIFAMMTANVTASSSSTSDSAGMFSLGSTGFILQWTNIGGARPYRYFSFGTGAIITQVTKTVTAPRFDIVGQVVDTNTIRQDIRQFVTDTNTIRQDIRQSLTKQATLLYQISLLVTKTRTLLHHIQSQVVDSNTLRFDIRQQTVADTNNLLFAISQLVTDTLTIRQDIRESVVDTTTLLHTIMQIVVDTNTLLQNIRQPVTDSNTLIFDIEEASNLLSVTKSLSLLQDIRQNVTDSNTIRYDIQQVIIKTETLLTTIYQSVTDTTTIRNDIRQSVTDSTTLLQHIRESVTDSLTLLQNIMQNVTDTNTLRYDIRQIVTDTNTIVFDIGFTGQVIKTLSLLQDVRGQVIQDISLRHDIRQPVTDTNTIISSIRQQITDTNTLMFGIRESVTKTRTLLQNIYQNVTDSTTLVQDIRQHVTDSTTARFNITTQIVKSISLLQTIYNSVVDTNTVLFSIAQDVRTSSTLRYDIIAQMTKLHSLLFEITGIAGVLIKEFTVRQDIRQKVVDTTSIRFDIRNTITKTQNLILDIRKMMVKTGVFNYAIRNSVIDSNPIRFNITIPAEKTLTSHFAVRELAYSRPLDILFDIRRAITKKGRINFDIISQMVKQSKLVFSIYPSVLTRPRYTTHEKLLDFIFAEYNISDPPREEITWHEWYNGQSDITIDSVFIADNLIPKRSTVIYKERNYSLAVHIFYRDYSDTNPENRNTPKELSNVINEIQRIIMVNKYSMYHDFGKTIYDVRIKDSKFIPEPEQTSSTYRIFHYRFTVELLYQKIVM